MTDLLPAPAVSHGIDVASFQHDGGQIDYTAVVEDLVSRTTGGKPATDFATPIIVFVIIKITDSDNYANPFAQADVDGFSAVQIPNVEIRIHLYHFLHAAVDAAVQHAWMIAHLPSGVDPLVWLDVEGGGLDGLGWGQMGSVVNAMLDFAETCGAYTNGEGLGSVLPYLEARNPVKPLWFADPSDTRPEIQRAITQVGTGPVAGIVGLVDLDTAQMDAIGALPAAKGVTPPVVTPEPVVDPTPPEPTPEPTPIEEPTPEPTPTPQGVTAMWPETSMHDTTAEHTKVVQSLLVAHGYDLSYPGCPPAGIDGDWGGRTQAALLHFQFTVFGQSGTDGIVGEQTMSALLGVS